MSIEAPDWACVLDAKASIAEMPVWVPEQDALYFLDLQGGTLNRIIPDSGATRTWTFPDMVGTFAFAPDLGHAVVALRDRIVSLDLDSGTLTELERADLDTTHYRFNDGRCDRAGRLWVGSLRGSNSPEPLGGAGWYRYGEDGLTRQFGGTTVANGLAWSPDNRTMYIADSPNRQLLAFDYDIDSGTASNRRVFATLNAGEIPDGAAVDTEGGYWIALFNAGLIIRFTPDGRRDRELRAPTTHPTMVAFGGPDLATLYVTSARHIPGIFSADTDAEPLAGGVFSADVGASGLPEPRYTRSPIAALG